MNLLSGLVVIIHLWVWKIKLLFFKFDPIKKRLIWLKYWVAYALNFKSVPQSCKCPPYSLFDQEEVKKVGRDVCVTPVCHHRQLSKEHETIEVSRAPALTWPRCERCERKPIIPRGGIWTRVSSSHQPVPRGGRNLLLLLSCCCTATVHFQF